MLSSEYEVNDAARDSVQPNIARALLPLEGVVWDARLDASSTTNWYLATQSALLMLSLSDGMPEPQVSPMQLSLTSDEYVGRVHVDGAPAVASHRGLYRSGA